MAHDAVLTAVFIILLLAWAWRLMFHKAWNSERAAGALADLMMKQA